jgi:hypothetical protein
LERSVTFHEPSAHFINCVTDLSYFDVGLVSLFYQFAVYVMIRLSHGGFTLGEVGLVALGSTVLFMDAVNMTVAKVCCLLSLKQINSEANFKDLAHYYCIHQDNKISNTPLNLSTRSSTWVYSHRATSLTTSSTFTSHLPITSSQAQTTTRSTSQTTTTTGNPAPRTSFYLLFLLFPYYIWPDRLLDSMVSRRTKPLDLGCPLAHPGEN